MNSLDDPNRYPIVIRDKDDEMRFITRVGQAYLPARLMEGLDTWSTSQAQKEGGALGATLRAVLNIQAMESRDTPVKDFKLK